jgi:hypothetical protein
MIEEANQAAQELRELAETQKADDSRNNAAASGGSDAD